MKTRKLLALILLVAMCFSFMAVTASADVIVADSPIIDQAPADNNSEPEEAAPTDDNSNIIIDDAEDEESIFDDENQDAANVIVMSTEPLTKADGEKASDITKVELHHGDKVKKYSVLNTAMLEAEDGDTIVLVKDYEIVGLSLKIKKGVTLDLGGNTLTFEPSVVCEDWAAISVETEKDVTIKNGTVAVPEHKLLKESHRYGRLINNAKGAKLVLEDLDLSKAETSDKYSEKINGKNIVCLDGIYPCDVSKYIDSEKYEVVKNEEKGIFEVKEKTGTTPTEKFGAMIGETKYKTFKEAYAAAEDGATIVLLENATADLTLDKSIILDMGGKEYTGEITVPAEKSLTLKNGKYTSRVYVSGSLTVADENTFVDTVEVCSKDAEINISAGNFNNVAWDSGIEARKLNITGGKFSNDVSECVKEGYYTKDVDGEFVVTALAALEVSPANVELYRSNIPEEVIFTVNGAVDSIKVNGAALDKENFTATVKDGKTVVSFKKAYLETLDNGEYNVEFAAVNTLGGKAKITVNDGAKLWSDRTADEYVKGSKKDMAFNSSFAFTEPEVDGTALKDGQYAGAGTKEITLKGEFLENLELGEHVLKVKTANGYASVKFTVVEKSEAVVCTLTNMDGTEPGTVNRFKGEAEKDQNKDAKFKYNEKTPLKKVMVGDVELTNISDYTKDSDTVTINKDSATIKGLNAGAHKLRFVFDVSGKEIVKEVDLMVYPSMVIVPTRYVKNSGVEIKITVSDKCDGLIAGSATDKLEKVPAESASFDGDSYSLKGSYLDNKAEGTFYIGLSLNGKAVLGAITIAPAPSVSLNKVNDKLNDNGLHEWENKGMGLSLDVKPDVKAVYVDGVSVSDKNYSVNKDGVLLIKYGFLDSLSYGKHKLIVSTSDGNTNELEFITKCGLAPKNGDKHTKGGRKDLDFVCSDPIKNVWVGKEALKSDFYTLSKDGKTLTLKADFMNKLRADRTFVLTIETIDGCTASTYFKILSPGAASSTPTTGDESNLMIWAAVLVLSGVGVIALIPKKKNQ